MTFFKQFGVKKPPLSARILLGVSDFFKHQWYVTPIVVVLLIALLVWMKSRPQQATWFAIKILLKAWLVRDITRYAAVERFCRIIGAMLRAGRPAPRVDAGRDRQRQQQGVRGEARNCECSAPRGRRPRCSHRGDRIFPIPAVQMIHVGEETGDLDNQLEIAAEYYSSELEYKLKKLMALFEPAIIVFMGVIVGFVAVTMIQSIYGMISGSNIGK